MARNIGWGDTVKKNTLSVVRALLSLADKELHDRELDQAVQVTWLLETELLVTGISKDRGKPQVGTTKQALIQLVESTNQQLLPPNRKPSTTDEEPEEWKLAAVQNVLDCLREMKVLKDMRPRSRINTPYWIFILTLKHQTAVKKVNLEYVEQKWNESVNQVNPKPTAPVPIDDPQPVDLKDAPLVDEDSFVGRTEMEALNKCIVEDGCRVVVLCGWPGIGKTTLARKLVEDIHKNFDNVIWRSLKIPRPLEEIMTEFIQFLSAPPKTRASFQNNKLSELIDCLKAKRYLLVLDDFESIMQINGARDYRKEYNELLRQISELEHKSCLLLISREKPKQIQEMQKQSVIKLQGLNVEEIKSIFKKWGISGSDNNEWQELTEKSRGNPLILKYIAISIKDNSEENISEFMQSRAFTEDEKKLYDEKFNVLSKREQEIVYWLAINREPVTKEVLKNDLFNFDTNDCELRDNIASLNRHFLLENTALGYTLHSVLMDYVTDKFVEKVYQEIKEGNLQLFKSHALLKTQAKDYIKSLQILFIIEPIINKLLKEYQDPNTLEAELYNILLKIRNKSQELIGYEAGNVLNLLTKSSQKFNLEKRNLSNLTIRQADLQNVKLYHVNFEKSRFKDCKFSNSLGGILWVVFSPDNKFLAVADVNSRIHLWEISYAKNDRLILKPYFILERSDNRDDSEGHHGWIWSLRFSPDSKYLASAGDDKTIIIWDVKDRKIYKTLTGHKDTIRSLSFREDGILASASDDGDLKLWDIRNIESRECIRTLSPDPNEARSRVRSVSFDPKDYRFLASAGDDKIVKIWDITTGKCIQSLREHQDLIRTITFSSDGQKLASAGHDKIVIIWGKDSKNRYRKINTLKGHQGLIRSVDFSRCGKFLVSASEDQTVKLWDASSGDFIGDLNGHTSWVQSVRFSPDGRILASGGADRTVKIWDISKGCLITLQGYTNCLFSIAYSPDGKKLASGHEDGMVRLWNIETGDCQEFPGHTDWVRSVTFSSDGRFIASSSGDRTIRLWDLENKSKLSEFQDAHESWIRQVRFSPNNSLLASCSDDNTIKIWNLKTNKCITTLTGHTNWVRSISFSSDNLLASASGDKTIKVWDIETGQCIQTLEGHDDWVWCVAFNPNGDILASGCGDGTIKIWRFNDSNGNWEEYQTLRKHQKSVRSVVFNSDGSLIVSGSTDKTVVIFDPQTWECIGEPKQHKDWVRSLTFSNEGNHLATASQDGSIHLWDDLQNSQATNTLELSKLYQGLDITGAIIVDISGARELNPSEIATFKALGAK